MRIRTIEELWHLTQIELCQLAQDIMNALPRFPADSLERARALSSLRNIRCVLARQDLAP